MIVFTPITPITAPLDPFPELSDPEFDIKVRNSYQQCQNFKTQIAKMADEMNNQTVIEDVEDWVAGTYAKEDKVMLDSVIYESLEDGNSDVPPSAKWYVIGGNDYEIKFENSDPLTTTNPTKDTIFVNKISGEFFYCIDNTVDDNIWAGTNGSKVFSDVSVLSDNGYQLEKYNNGMTVYLQDDVYGTISDENDLLDGYWISTHFNSPELVNFSIDKECEVLMLRDDENWNEVPMDGWTKIGNCAISGAIAEVGVYSRAEYFVPATYTLEDYSAIYCFRKI